MKPYVSRNVARLLSCEEQGAYVGRCQTVATSKALVVRNLEQKARRWQLEAISQSRFNSRARIQIIAQRIANEVEAQYCKHHRESGKKDKMWCVEQMRSRVVEHCSPTR